MRIFFYILLLSTLLITASSCFNNRANADVEYPGERGGYQAFTLIGKYEGELPCADCSAISTTLVLRQDRTYSLHYMYVGKSAEQFQKSGSWRVVADVLHLESEDYNYKIMENKLSQLDLSGKEMTGTLAGKYILNRSE